ncbi:GpE family phage tail protein [Escherichia coli]
MSTLNTIVLFPLTEVLEWRYKAIQRSGANDE